MRACNGTKLDMYCNAMISNIDSGYAIRKGQIMDSLDFVIDKNALCHYYNHNFSNTIEYDKNTITDKTYHLFANLCLEIYNECDELFGIALCIFFEEVTNEYYSYYRLKKEMENFRKPSGEIDAQKFLGRSRNVDGYQI